MLRTNGDCVNETCINGDTALIAACRHNHLSLVLLLLQGGADIRHKNRWGQTAVDVARKQGFISIVSILEDRIAEEEGCEQVIVRRNTGSLSLTTARLVSA